MSARVVPPQVSAAGYSQPFGGPAEEALESPGYRRLTASPTTMSRKSTDTTSRKNRSGPSICIADLRPPGR
jgi:hypothetical protein